jgi:hypothetical protein
MMQRAGLRSLPSHRKVRLTARQAPTASPGLRLENVIIVLCLGKQTLQPRVFLFPLLELFFLCGFHAPVQLLTAVIGGSRNLQGSAHVSDVLSLTKQLISISQLADDLLGVVALAFQGASSE